MKSTVNPRNLGDNTKKMVKTSRGVLLEMVNGKQKQVMELWPDFKEAGLEITPLSLKHRSVIVYDVDSTDPEKKVLNIIYFQNLRDVLPRKEFLE